MKKSELRVAVQEMDTYQFGLKNELHNKLTKVTSYVPKQEVLKLIDQLEFLSDDPQQEKVVVPQFVADYIEIAKQDINLIRVFDIANNHEELDKWKKEYEWIRGNHEKFAKAWFGYTVEKEKLYKVKLSKYDYLVQDGDGTVFTMDTNIHEYEDIFTEQEIKSIDERYWAFAEEITK